MQRNPLGFDDGFDGFSRPVYSNQHLCATAKDVLENPVKAVTAVTVSVTLVMLL
jgi:hypothetical protein